MATDGGNAGRMPHSMPDRGHEASSAAKPHPVVIPVTGGTFYCSNCGARWVGTWRGDPTLMTCRWCDHPMNGDDDAE